MKNLAKVVLLLPLIFTACASEPKVVEEKGTVEILYNKALDDLEKGNHRKAVNTFEELERQHPYSGWATRAQMMVAYAHFREEDYDETIVAAERFIRMHPGHKDLDYMFYLKGMSFYNRIKDVRRDQANTMEALQTFEEMRRRFPTSEYAKDARLKISLCLDHLAGQEMVVGRFYQDEKRFMPAINRYRFVVENYQTTSHTAEALYRLVETYISLGVDQEAQISAAVLGHNFPESDWYKAAYELLQEKDLKPDAEGYEKSWMKQLVKGWKEVF